MTCRCQAYASRHTADTARVAFGRDMPARAYYDSSAKLVATRTPWWRVLRAWWLRMVGR
jgi:hypothetical protein